MLFAVAGWWAYRHTRPVVHPPDTTPGVSLALAQDRALRVAALRNAVSFRVPADRSKSVVGHMSTSFDLSDASKPLVFDFAQPPDHLVNVTIRGRAIQPEVRNGHIVIAASDLRKGTNTIEFEFIAGDEALNRNDEFMYTLFVPARASTAMPCFDQPDLKAHWLLTLDMPPTWVAVSNAPEHSKKPEAGDLIVDFEETAPLPPYLFAFAAGKFRTESVKKNGRTLRMLHRETDRAKVERNMAELFDQHDRALDWMAQYTNIPYRFDKFDFVLIPSFQFSGMEHPGAVYYNASALLLDETATQSQLLDRAIVVAHETAHMWFGNLVTMRWFDDVWMKEVFANFFADKMVAPTFPEINHDLRFLMQHVPAAYDVDRTEGANPIRQELANLSEAGTLYGDIIYQKSPVVMRQLEGLMGPEVFQKGLHDYLSNNAFGNASWNDLVTLLSPRMSVSLAEWSRSWITERGRPTIKTDLRLSNGKIERLAFQQSDPRGRPLVWPQKLQVLVNTGTGVLTFEPTLKTSEIVLYEAANLPAPVWVLPVGGGSGYGFFDLDPITLSFLTGSFQLIGDPVTRGAALIALWESMLEGRLPPSVMMNSLIAAVAVEKEELTLQQMLSYIRTAFWRYTPAEGRAALAARLEPLLREKLKTAPTSTAKAAWFNTVRSVALTPGTVEWLEQIWRRQQTIPGLPLAEQDEISLALDLAVRDVPSAAAILTSQVERTQNPDRRARLEFLIPAVSSDANVRNQFFESLKDVRNRSHEAWVIDAARLLNHPLRATTSERYVKPALELVREIQATGDIFFPKRWADATLSGYQSTQTAATVRTLIGNLPADYPVRLRWILEASADPLFRASRLVHR